MHGAGAQEMTWAYVLSGAIAVALLVYLVVALFRAEDL
jgi:K+-transporting ATPase KdpF subunit